MIADELELRFKFRNPSLERFQAHMDVQNYCRFAAHWLDQILPDGREKDKALDSIQEVMMWAHAALQREENQQVCPSDPPEGDSGHLGATTVTGTFKLDADEEVPE